MDANGSALLPLYDLRLTAIGLTLSSIALFAGYALACNKEFLSDQPDRTSRKASVGALSWGIWCLIFLSLLSAGPKQIAEFEISGLVTALIMCTLAAYSIVCATVRAVPAKSDAEKATDQAPVISASPEQSILFGALAGLAISAAQYSALNATVIGDQSQWDMVQLALTVIVTAALSVGSTWVCNKPGSSKPYLAAVVMLVAVLWSFSALFAAIEGPGQFNSFGGYRIGRATLGISIVLAGLLASLVLLSVSHSERLRRRLEEKEVELGREIDIRIRAESEIAKKRERLLSQQDALTALIRSPGFLSDSWEDGARALTETSAEVLGVSRVTMWLYADDRLALNCVDTFEKKQGIHSHGFTFAISDNPAYFAALPNEKDLAIDNVAIDERTKILADSYFSEFGITSVLDVPIVRNGIVEGVLSHEHVGKPTSWTPDQRLFAVMCGSLAALIVERRQRLKAEQDILDANANVSELNGELSQNILRLKEAHDEIIKKSKLAQLGQLIATVAHEIRNPLGAVSTATFVLARKLGNNAGEVAPQLERITNGVKRCDAIITQLLDFARTSSPTLESKEIDSWLEHELKELAQQLPPAIDIKLESGLKGQAVLFDPVRIRRAIVNLVSNASEAMVGKGDDPSKFTTAQPQVRIITSVTSRGIEIVVSDNGPGIPEEYLDKIFEPLFTTKSFGTGLGLPAVEKIMQQHGGGLELQSTPGAGASFTLWLPSKPAARLEAA